MEFKKIYAQEVFKDFNKGYKYGLEWDIGNEEYHNIWFKTEEERENFLKKYSIRELKGGIKK